RCGLLEGVWPGYDLLGIFPEAIEYPNSTGYQTDGHGQEYERKDFSHYTQFNLRPNFGKQNAMLKTHFPEILAPAGSLDKLKVAVLYGANAVYVGGQKFGLRTAGENFTLDELREGLSFAHERGAKVYVVLNSFLHDKDLAELPDFVRYLEEIGTDAVIVSDLGVIQTVREHSQIPVHISTQASSLNVHSAHLWKKAGASRIVLGREVSVKEAGKIRREADI